MEPIVSSTRRVPRPSASSAPNATRLELRRETAGSRSMSYDQREPASRAQTDRVRARRSSGTPCRRMRRSAPSFSTVFARIPTAMALAATSAASPPSSRLIDIVSASTSVRPSTLAVAYTPVVPQCSRTNGSRSRRPGTRAPSGSQRPRRSGFRSSGLPARRRRRLAEPPSEQRDRRAHRAPAPRAAGPGGARRTC